MARLLRAAMLIACFLYAGRALAAGGTCPSGADYPGSTPFSFTATLSSLGITSCYFVSAAGSDSNSGTSEGSPWAHLPTMPNAGGNAAAHKPAAGEGFILRGGDTWTDASMGMSWTCSGCSATNPNYIGVDKSWFSGGSWARPIWRAPNTPNQVYFSTTASNVIVDNIEASGGYSNNTTGPYLFQGCAQNVTFEEIYAHGWSHLPGMTTNPGGIAFATGCGTNTTGLTIRYNVVDGSDEPGGPDMFTGVRLSGPNVYGNVFHNLVSGVTGCGDNWHDNLVDTLVSPPGGAHQDGLYQYSNCYASTVFIYNNVIRNTLFSGSGGAVKLWFNGNAPTRATTYAFGNILYNNQPGNMVDTGGHLSGVSYGTINFFNNTIQCGTDSNMGNCIVGMNTGATLNWFGSNNHWIQSSTVSPLSCTNNPGGTCSATNDVLQTLSQANAQGYTDSSEYAFQPTSTSGATVTAVSAAAAATRQSLCATIGTVDAGAGTACQSDSTYACNYDTTNHTVRCPMRQTFARTADPNVGAYQYSSSEASIPNPPAGLTVSVQ